MMIREVEGILGHSVVVEVTREIKVGGQYKIQPTEAFLGIKWGTVKVVDIAARDALTLDMVDLANDFIEDVGMDRRFDIQPWVVYEYEDSDEDAYILPLQEFVIHTTIY